MRKVSKMYALFMWSRYYPNGGSGDLIGTYSSLEGGALQAAKENSEFNDKYEVMDSSFNTVAKGVCNDLWL